MEEEYIYKIDYPRYGSGSVEKAKWFTEMHKSGWELVCADSISVHSGYSSNSNQYIFRKKVFLRNKKKTDFFLLF